MSIIFPALIKSFGNTDIDGNVLLSCISLIGRSFTVCAIVFRLTMVDVVYQLAAPPIRGGGILISTNT